jgi:hypothetical protein
MRIHTLEVDGVRAFGQRTFTFGDARGAASVVAVFGPPSSGKTTLLESIIVAKENIGPYGGGPFPEHLLAPGHKTAKINSTWQLAREEQERFQLSQNQLSCETLIGSTVKGPPHEPALVALLSEYDAAPSSGKVEYFHARRRLLVDGPSDMSKAAGDAFDRRQRLAASDDKYESLVRFIVSSGLALPLGTSGAPPEPGRVTRAFAALCKSKRIGGLYQEGDRVLPGFLDGDDAVHAVGELSDSETDALLFAATFVRAGLVHNEPGSLILIDGPERHFGDAAGDLVRALHQLGTNNQLIVATGCRAVAEAADVVVALGGA